MTFPFLGALLTPPTPGPLTWKVGAINTDGSGFVTIDPNLGGIGVFLPAISDNGAKVAFSAFTSPTRLYVANGDGSNLSVPVTGQDPAQGGVSLTADGSRVVYGLAGDIFTARTDGSGVQQVTNNPGFLSYAPKVSGAGTSNVFISNANLTSQNPDGNDEVFLVDSCQPVRPVANDITLGYGSVVSWSRSPHNGTDYHSPLGNPIRTVGPGGIIHKYTKADAGRFGSIDPNGGGPAVWVTYTLLTGEPIYVLYGHTATTWDDKSTGSGSTFQFNATYGGT